MKKSEIVKLVDGEKEFFGKLIIGENWLGIVFDDREEKEHIFSMELIGDNIVFTDIIEGKDSKDSYTHTVKVLGRRK